MPVRDLPRDLNAARDAYQRLEAGPSGAAEAARLSQMAHNMSAKCIGKMVHTPEGNGKIVAVKDDGSAYTVQLDGKEEPRQFPSGDVTFAMDGGAPENHGSEASEFIKSMVFGGLDGIVTTFAIVATSYGAGLSSGHLFLLGLSNLVADGLAMGLGDYLSSKAELEHALAEKKREMWEMENYPEGEINEMIELYKQRGIDHRDATQIVRTMAKYREFFVDVMMVEELKLAPPDEDDNPAKGGAVTFLAFLLFGSVPLAAYAVVTAFFTSDAHVGFASTCIVTLLTLFVLGWVKGSFIRQNKFNAGMQMMLNGAFATGCGYGIAKGLDHAFGTDAEEPAAPKDDKAGGKPPAPHRLLKAALNALPAAALAPATAGGLAAESLMGASMIAFLAAAVIALTLWTAAPAAMASRWNFVVAFSRGVLLSVAFWALSAGASVPPAALLAVPLAFAACQLAAGMLPAALQATVSLASRLTTKPVESSVRPRLMLTSAAVGAVATLLAVALAGTSSAAVAACLAAVVLAVGASPLLAGAALEATEASVESAGRWIGAPWTKTSLNRQARKGASTAICHALAGGVLGGTVAAMSADTLLVAGVMTLPVLRGVVAGALLFFAATNNSTPQTAGAMSSPMGRAVAAAVGAGVMPLVGALA